MVNMERRNRTGTDGRARPSRQDVARAAGVSLTTVTHALNETPGARVSEATRQRIKNIATECGYRPSFVGRALVMGKTFTVGVLQPYHDAMFSHFYQQMLLGLVRAMEPEDYHPLILFRDDEYRYLRAVTQGRMDGVVVLQSDFVMDHIQRVIASGFPTVVLNKGIVPPRGAQVGCVHSDHRRLMHEVVDELVSRGCRTILEVNDHRDCDANTQMLEAFIEATERHAAEGVTGSTIVPSSTDFRSQIRSAFAAGQRWDGVFIDAIRFAEKFVDEASQAGFEAGRDYQLVTSSVADGETTRARREQLAYTQQPLEVGAACWKLLKGLMEGTAAERTVLVPYKRYEVAGMQGDRK